VKNKTKDFHLLKNAKFLITATVLLSELFNKSKIFKLINLIKSQNIFMRYKIIIISCIFILINSCKNNLVGPIQYSPEQGSLYLSIDGKNAGIWVMNTETFELKDSITTEPGVPFTIQFSKDNSKFYTSWKNYTNNQAYIYCVDNKTMSILQQMSVGPSVVFLEQNREKTMLIGYLDQPLRLYDIETLSFLYGDTSGAITTRVKCSSKQDICYLTQIVNRTFTGLTIYNLQLNRIEKIIPVADETRQQIMEPADLAISPDDHYAFISVFNWIGGGGYNTLFVIDLEKSEVIGEYGTGAFAQLCVSPDGHYLYISDPAGYLRQMRRTNEILRYNIINGSMEIFLKLSDLGLSGTTFITDKMAITSDNRVMFVSTAGDIKDRNNNWVSLLKIDLVGKSILKTYSFPLDSLGRQIQIIRNIKLAP
jgi:DNA-binding beta-propeller fold protein YncE